ncbi:serine/threonine protein kinase [Chthoniobacter flavus Ellin428]|uniref:Serine/threonine protein kinase n=1 Tax=Chthoniobacter flavus Ellin428 TaxID=497964 RepID=B4CTR2_9BACT|nr:SUMF1/EgtB/PvdO family nonheme iron enzyme [Chthoniobacter flavus]EDY21950.1 serine/threonine protein kinase [Chthoniobacter flavus Ellin428]
MRILLVDDDTAIIQNLLASLKTLPGHEVRVATNGQKALENAAALGGVDLLITDVVMEPMDGFTLRDHLVSQYPGIRTIFITGYDLSDYPEQTSNHQLLTKPFQGEELLAAIAREMLSAQPAAPAAVPRAAIPVRGPSPMDVVDQPTMRIELPPDARGGGPAAPKKAAPAPRAVPSGAHATVRVPGTTKIQPVPAPSAPQAAPRPATQQPAPAATARATAVPKAATAPVPRAPVAPPPPVEPEFEPETEEDTSIGSLGTQLVEASDPGELAGQLFGAYLLDQKIAEGRLGSVYFAVQVSINRPVGIEILDADKADDPDTRDRFIADARAKAQVQHPSIIAVYEAGEANGRYFYAHEYVDGTNLAQLKAAGSKLDEISALKILRVASEGLAYLDSHNIPHQVPDASSISVGKNGQSHLANLAEQATDEQLPPEEEIKILGRIMLSVLPAVQSLNPGLRDLLKGMVQTGPDALTTWGKVLQGIKAIEPKVIPIEAAKISAQDRAAIAAVELARKQQKRTLYFSVASVCSLIILTIVLIFWVYSSNERNLDEQVDIPAGEFIFAVGESKTLPEFWIDKYEVTYGQYAKFVQFLEQHPTSEYDDPRQPRVKTAAMHKPEHWEIYYQNAKAGKAARGVKIDLNCPVMEVDYWDAYAYAKWKGRELPTEEEWEKAARGTKGFKFPGSDDFNPKNVNSGIDHDPNHPDAKGAVDGYNFWNPVDKIKGDKSPFGVIGMAGNVSEWTGSWDAAKRRAIVKGGSFAAKEVNLDKRAEIDPNKVDETIGFRTVSHTPPAKK